MRIKTQSGIITRNLTAAMETIMSGLVNAGVVITPTYASADELGDAAALTPLLGSVGSFAGVSSVSIASCAFNASDIGELFTTPITNVEAVTITKVGVRFQASCATYTPSNLAENISGLSSRTTLRGVGELVSALIAGDGVGLSGISAVVMDQGSKKVSLIDGSVSLTSGLSSAITEAIISEISPVSQGWFEAA